MPWTFVESAQEFIERNGGSPLALSRSEGGRKVTTPWLILPSGARIQAMNAEVRMDPPLEPAAKLQGEILYLQMKLARINDNYRNCQNYIYFQAEIHHVGAGGFPRPDSYEYLESCQVACREVQAAIEAKEMALAEVAEPSKWDEYVERRKQEKQTAAASIEKVRQVVGNPPPLDPLTLTAKIATERAKFQQEMLKAVIKANGG